MRKAYFYIILFFSIFTHAATARSIETAKDAVHKKTDAIALQQNDCTSEAFKNIINFQKNDFINDIVDYDEYDFDDNETSLRSRSYFVISVKSNNNSFKIDSNSDSSCSKIYYHANFSRLPRYNYISLRVLRL